MFSFFKRKPADAADGLVGLGCDMHSHLIPGIDDGVKTVDDSIRLIRGLMELGYRKIITTPHINADIFPNTPEIIRNGEALVRAELARQGLEVGFSAAAEYLMDDHFYNLLSEGQQLLTLKDNMVLVELSFAVPAINLKELLFDLQVKGYQPVLAHPERYLYFGANKGWYDQLKETGCLFQLNLLSLRGHYGQESQQLAEWLIKKKYVDLVGTDMHHERHLELLRSPRVFKTVRQLLDAGLLRNPDL
ncbi:MAG: histidinol phosphatase [Bacteroidetes bacterium]|nr:histidinol phosphatase [Bacteroidota bacterium]